MAGSIKLVSENLQGSCLFFCLFVRVFVFVCLFVVVVFLFVCFVFPTLNGSCCRERENLCIKTYTRVA